MKYAFQYETFRSADELSAEDRELVETAKKATEKAYAPYSGFRVGAALRTGSGRLFSASNQESEVFPSGMCAERALLYYYQATGSDDPVTSLAVYSPDTDFITPCGACRQVLLDTEIRQKTPYRILLASEKSTAVLPNAAVLLPLAFRLPEH